MTDPRRGDMPLTDDDAGAGTAHDLGFLDLALALAQHLRLLVFVPILAAAIAVAATFLMPKYFRSTTVFLPPQQQSMAASALSQLGALSGLAGAVGGFKSTAEQYLALLQSTTIADRLIDDHDLMRVYEEEFRFKAREELSRRSTISLGRKDGLITIEVEDTDPQRAADLANQYVTELQYLSGRLALSEAQQRRVFFEGQLEQTRSRLTSAQQALQASGFSQGDLNADARAAAEAFARLRAEATAGEVRLQTLRRTLADNTPEVQQALATLGALRGELSRMEQRMVPASGDADYIGRYREFKYQETLFDLFARQYELARVDESREGALVQVIDRAQPAEWKSRPRRALIGIGVYAMTLALVCAWAVAGMLLRVAGRDADTASKLARLNATIRGRR